MSNSLQLINKCSNVIDYQEIVLSVEPTDKDDSLPVLLPMEVYIISIGFMEDDVLVQKIHINFNYCQSYQSQSRDSKVRDTIVSIVDEFFNRNNLHCFISVKQVMTNKRMRSRLFEYWFSTYNRKAFHNDVIFWSGCRWAL